MALSEELPVFKDAYELLERLFDLAADMPRFCRHTLGTRMIDDCLEMLDAIYRANSSQQMRSEWLQDLLARYRRLQMMLRVCYHRKALSSGRYADLLLLLDSIGRQATAWKNKA